MIIEPIEYILKDGRKALISFFLKMKKNACKPTGSLL